MSDASPPQPQQSFWQRYRVPLGIAAAFVVLIIIANIFGQSNQEWVKVGGNVGHPLALASDPMYPDIVFVGTEDSRLLSSSDGGQSWVEHANGLPKNNAPISAIAFSPDKSRMFVGTNKAVFASDDRGQNWKALDIGLPTDDVYSSITVVSPDGKSILTGSSLRGIFRTSDGGQRWDQSNTGLPKGTAIYDIAVTADFKEIYAATIRSGIYVSLDGGITWQSRNTGLPADIDAFSVTFAQTPDGKATRYLVGTSKGVYVSMDKATTWQPANKGLPMTRVIHLFADTVNASQVFAATDDGVFATANTGDSWQPFARSLPTKDHVGKVLVAHPSTGVVVYAASDALYRFPGPSLPLINMLVQGAGILLLGGLFIWIWMRQRRVLSTMTPTVSTDFVQRHQERERQARIEKAREHIRGGPPPPTSPKNDEE